MEVTEAEALDAFQEFSTKLGLTLARQKRKEPPPLCKLKDVGEGEGMHQLCDVQYDCACRVITYGVQYDWSFEKELGEACCRVFASDPTVNYKAGLEKNVWFMQIGAPNPADRAVEAWNTADPASMRRLLFPSARVSVLKMDCESCEYAIYPTVFAVDPHFFESVDQFSVEAHITNNFMRTHEDFLNYGKLLALLRRAKLQLVSASLNWCGPINEATGCPPWLAEYGYPCSQFHQCHNFLFAREGLNQKAA
jgi:hypothetical protein